ncbi:hypothetical protein GGI12_002412 [Dipsacomyces acuminosporus]|nr:hypothetical protein GGI12_002412 [Dipsacomyces acuminosporus]
MNRFQLSFRRPKVTRLHMVQAAVVLIVVLMTWGKRMGSSLMSPLKSTLKQELSINNTQWASVISMVWVVSTLTPFIAGLVIDLMGAPLAGAISLLLILGGNGICAIAVATRSLSLFLTGRAIYSLGGGAVLLVGEVIMLKWFKGRQLPVAFGCASTLGSLLWFTGPAAVTAILKKNASVVIPFWLATGLSAFGLVCFGFYAMIHYSHYASDIEAVESGFQDKRASVSIAKVGSEYQLLGEGAEDKEPSKDAEASIELSEKSLVRIYSTAPSIDHPEADTKLESSMSPTPTPDATKAAIGALGYAWRKTKWLFFGLAALPESYWHVLLCISVQGTLFIPMHEIVPEMMETEWAYSRAEASKVFVYLHIIPIVLHVILGIFINRFGQRLNMLFAGSVLVFLAAVFITWVRQIPILLSLILMNFSHSMVPAAIFSMMNIVIDNGKIAGAALGLIRSAEYAAVTLMEMLDGLLQDADDNKYDTVLIGLVVFAGILFVIAAVSLVVDHTRNDGVLNSADPYKKLGYTPLGPQVHLDSRDATKQSVKSDTGPPTQEPIASSAAAHPQIPKRRYYYIGSICILLVTAWALFILSLARM